MTENAIQRIDAGGGGSFIIPNPGGGEPRYWAELTYRWRDGVMVILHTGVREQLQGRGVARKLVEAAIAAARAESFRIEPQCSYAASVFEKAGDELADVRA